MKKNIMLTLLAVYVILICVGCESGNLFVSDERYSNEEVDANMDIDIFEESGEKEFASGDVFFSGEEMATDNENLISGDEANVINEETNTEEYVYNESGKIIIVMFHKFAQVENDEWTRSYDNFYNDLKYLYEHNYRVISLNDYLDNNIKVPVGCTPIIFTFDDGTKGQFNLIKNEQGELVANPMSAVGIMEKFYAEHPDFGLNGTFFINTTSFFPGEGTDEEKLNYLIERGFEIGNHTSTHINFSKASIETIKKEVGSVANLVKKLTNGYEITSLALPYGVSSKEYKSYIASGEYEGEKYENKALLLVGAEPAPSPTSEKLNLLSLPRVRARGGEKEVAYDLYYWLEIMEKNPNLKYERKS